MATAFVPPCDETRGRHDAPGGDCANKRGTLIATVAGSSLAFVVGSIVNVALPAMQREFSLDAVGAQWIINAYLLPLGALVLIGGALGDHYGRRKVYLAGLTIFLLASVACALAPSYGALLAARACLGLGAALIAPNSLSIIADGFSGKERGAAVGTWAAGGAIAGAIAPVAGGWIVDIASWRWAFGLVAPLAAGAMIVTLRSVRESRADRDSKAPLDWLGAAIAGLGLFALIYGLVALMGPDANQPLAFAALAVGMALLLVFAPVERRMGDRAMAPPGLFATTSFSGISLLTLFLYGALGGLLVLLPYVLIQAFDYGATAAGAALLPFPLVMGLLSRRIGGVVASRLGTRSILAVGATLVAVGFLLLSRLPTDGLSYWGDVMPGLIVLALGMAASVAPLTNAVLNSAGATYTGVASGVNNAISRIAGLVATALLGPVLASGAHIVDAFEVAAWVGAGLAAASAITALALIDPAEVDPEEEDGET